MKNIIYTLALIIILFSCDDSASKRHLLKNDKEWNERSDTEKLTGCWCEDNGSSHTSRRGLKIDFNEKICFYNNGTMDEFLVSDSYVKNTDLLRSGVNVSVSNNILTYFDSESGHKSEKSVYIEMYKLKIGNGRYYSKCN